MPKHISELDMRPQRVDFLVGRRPYRFIDIGLADANLRLVRALDGHIFLFQAKALSSYLYGPTAVLAAASLRHVYHVASETFLALAVASLQAPDCVYGWLLKYKNQDLDECVATIRGHGELFNKLGIDKVTWDALADQVFALFGTEEERKGLAADFGRFWRKIADDYLDETVQAEHMSLKHGMRCHLGGFSLSFSSDPMATSECEERKWMSVGESKYGLSFRKWIRLDSASSIRNDPRHYTVEIARNWNDKQLVGAIDMLSKSIWNLSTFLRILLKDKSEDVPMVMGPENDAQVTQSVHDDVPINNLSFNFNLRPERFQKVDADGVIASLAKHSNCRNLPNVT